MASVLSDLLKKHQLKPAEASRRTGINPAQWSRWLNGDQSFMSPDDAETIAKTILSEPQEQAKLLRARLLETCAGPGSELIEIQIKNQPSSAKIRPMLNRCKLPAKVQRDLDLILKHLPHDKSLRDLVHSIASYADGKLP